MRLVAKKEREIHYANDQLLSMSTEIHWRQRPTVKSSI